MVERAEAIVKVGEKEPADPPATKKDLDDIKRKLDERPQLPEPMTFAKRLRKAMWGGE